MILASICIGTIGTLVKLIGQDVHFMTLNFYRFFIGFLFILAVVPFIDKNTFKINKKDFKDYFFVGFLFALGSLLFIAANVFAPVQNAVLISSFFPFFVFIFAYFILKEKITYTKIIALLIAVIGLAIINPFRLGEYALGNTLALFTAVVAALMTTEMRKIDMTHSIGVVFWMFLFATLLLLPMPFIFGFGDLSNVFLYVLLLGLIPGGIAYLFYNLALEKIEAEVGSIMQITVAPTVAIVLAIVIIGEPISIRIILGGFSLIVAGIYLETHNLQLKK